MPRSKIIPASEGLIREASVSITSSIIHYDLTGAETYVMVELPANGTALDIEVGISYSIGGTMFPAQILPMAPLLGVPMAGDSSFYTGWSGGYNTAKMGVNAVDYTNRVFFVPCTGAARVSFRRASVGTTVTTVRSYTGPPPYVNALSREQRSIVNFSDDVAITTSYADADVIGGTKTINPFYNTNNQFTNFYRGAQWRFTGIAWTDYGAGLGDLDLLVMIAGDNSVVADSAPLSLDYGESVLAWYEFRSAPTGDQYKTHSYGAGNGIGGQFSGEEIWFPYGNGEFMIDLLFVNRAGAITPAAGSLWFNLFMEF